MAAVDSSLALYKEKLTERLSLILPGSVLNLPGMAETKTILRRVVDAGTGRKKWHKLRHVNRIRYLTLVLEKKVVSGGVYFAHYEKPIPYFFPIVEVLYTAISRMTTSRYKARIHVDGIDQQKAKELTNALRAKGIMLHKVRSRRDESEPLIRLADMWAGCIRSALLHKDNAEALVLRATRGKYLSLTSRHKRIKSLQDAGIL